MIPHTKVTFDEMRADGVRNVLILWEPQLAIA